MYNVESCIGNCLDSVLNQDIPLEDYEIIIMNDGSTDKSYEIASNYARRYSNIQLYSHDNIGLYSTRNKMLKLAQGDYIFNLDSDDYLAHNCLLDVLKLAEDKELDVIGFDTIETTQIDNYGLSQPMDINNFNTYTGKTFFENHLYYRNEIWWYLLRRDYLTQQRLTFEDNQYNADVTFTIQAIINTDKMGYWPIPIHRYVQTQDSLMRSEDFEIKNKRIAYIQMMIIDTSRLLNKLKKKPEYKLVIHNLSYRRDIFTFFNIIYILRNPYSLKYVKEKLAAFKAVNAYPIRHFSNDRYKDLKWRLLLKIINSERLLYILVRLKNMLTKKRADI